MRIDHIMLRTTDLEKSEHFYTEVMGMKIIAWDNRMDSPDNRYNSFFAAYEETGAKMEIVYNDGKDDPDIYQNGNVVGHVGIYVEDIIKIQANAITHGFHFERIVTHKNGNKEYKIGTIKGPEGVNLALVQKIS